MPRLPYIFQVQNLVRNCLLSVIFCHNTYQVYGLPDSFDFVVVGGGTAGCAVASRLSENGKHSVILLEVGHYPHPDLETPALGTRLLGDPSVSRVYETVPQRNAALNFNGSINYMVGWTLGGGSAINGMFMNRGHPSDFDNWANVTGDESWNYSNMLQYFKRSEAYYGEFPSDQHGYTGPIPVGRPKFFAPQLTEWLEAGQELGYEVADQNGPQRTSFTPVHTAIGLGRRVSSFYGYIRPHLNSRKNLRVITNAEVRKVLFEGDRAVGVSYTDTESGRPRFIRADREVILSAGVVGSAAILMKSGVGPRDILKSANIPVVKYLPVGKNFQDHTASTIYLVVNNTSATFNPERDLTPENFRLYNQVADGPYTYSMAGPGQAFFPSSIAKRDGNPNWPDVQLVNSMLGSGIPELNEVHSPIELADWEADIFCGVSVRGKTRGRVMLNLTDVNMSPIIDMQYLSHPDDIQMLVEGIKLALDVHEKTDSFRRLGARYPPTPLQGCQHLKFRSDEYWRCYVAQTAISGIHGAGTCRMGSGPRDREAVVDSKLKVIGIHGLRVVDASIMPLLTNANPMAAIYGIAEKASDMILRDIVVKGHSRRR